MTVPGGIERDFDLARLTTVRAGGPAEMFARAGSEERLVELLAYARGVGAEVGVVGSGSNLLVADDGFRGLVLKLDGDLARIERDGERCSAGPPSGCLRRPPSRPAGGSPGSSSASTSPAPSAGRCG